MLTRVTAPVNITCWQPATQTDIWNWRNKGGPSSNTWNLYLGGISFKSQLGQRQFRLRFFVAVLSSSWQLLQQ